MSVSRETKRKISHKGFNFYYIISNKQVVHIKAVKPMSKCHRHDDVLDIPLRIAGFPVVGLDFGCGEPFESVKRLNLPYMVSEITTIWLRRLTHLEQIDVSIANEQYYSSDGILYSYEERALVCYPGARSHVDYSIPEGIERIDKNAFDCGTRFERLFLPESIDTIEWSLGSRDPLAQCQNLAEVFVDKSNKWYASVDGILIDKISNRIVLFPPKRENPTFTLSGLLVTPESNLPIYDSSIRHLEFGKDVVDFPHRIPGLMSITVSEENQVFRSIDGVLFTKDMTMLLFYPDRKVGETYYVPYGVVSISSYAFAYCMLRRVILPETVVEIDSYAFYGSNQLRSVELPHWLEKIGKFAFCDCSHLESITVPEMTTVGCGAFWDTPFD